MKIKSIKKIQPRTVYAIQTSTHTFVADGLAHHNCWQCNCGKNGQWVEYERFMLARYGKKITEEIKKNKDKIKQFTIEELKGIIADYKKKLSTFES